MPLKARHVERIYKNRGATGGSMYCMQRVAEEQAALRQMLMECAQAIDQLAELATTAAMIADGSAVAHGNTRKTVLASAMERAMGRDIDAPEGNPHDKHNDEGAPTNPDDMRDD